MPEATWWRNVTIALVALGICCAAAFIATTPADGQLGWHRGLLLLGGTAGLWAALSLPFVLRTYRRDAALRAGEGVRAQWVLTPSEWERFVREESARPAVPETPANLVSLRRQVPAEGLTVLIGTDGVIVGAEYHHLLPGIGRLRARGPFWSAGSPARLEYRLVVTDANDALVDRVLRIPVAEQAEAAARSLVSP